MRRLSTLVALFLTTSAAACGDDSSASGSDASSSESGSESGASAGEAEASTSASGEAEATTAEAEASSGDGDGDVTTGDGDGDGTTGDGDGDGDGLPDPNQDGPYPTATLDASLNVAATGDTVDIHVVYPTGGPSAGPYPVILVGHGFQLPPSQYYSYLERLGTFGYVAMTVDFPAGFTGVNNVEQAQDLLAALDWADADATLGGIVDTDNVGTTGHSLGGKVSIIAASMDNRVKASFTLDPVDGAMNCNPTDCPDASDLLPFGIPVGFIGETIDASGGFMSCAPAADNFETFYANTSAPSLKVDVLGANHMSFLDDLSSCGITCGFCNAATLDNAVVNNMARAFTVAWYERHLRGITGYDAYLTGAIAQQRYVDNGQATIVSK